LIRLLASRSPDRSGNIGLGFLQLDHRRFYRFYCDFLDALAPGAANLVVVAVAGSWRADNDTAAVQLKLTRIEDTVQQHNSDFLTDSQMQRYRNPGYYGATPGNHCIERFQGLNAAVQCAGFFCQASVECHFIRSTEQNDLVSGGKQPPCQLLPTFFRPDPREPARTCANIQADPSGTGQQLVSALGCQFGWLLQQVFLPVIWQPNHFENTFHIAFGIGFAVWIIDSRREGVPGPIVAGCGRPISQNVTAVFAGASHRRQRTCL